MKIPRNPLAGAQRPYRARVFWSYLPDWVLTIFLWGIFYLIDKVDGYRRLFDVTNNSLAHPYAEHERVPVWMLAVLFGLVPGVLIILVAGLQRSFWDLHNGVLGFILGLGLCVTFTDIVKVTVGRPRPDFFSRCQLPPGTQNPEFGLTSWRACTRTEKLKDGFRSFPSGHSSFAWAGMWYLVLYMAAKFRIANQRGYAMKSWLLLAPICGASLVSISRTMDYRHHATDVIAGAIVGILASWWAYRQYYPPIGASKSHRPYPPRIPSDMLPTHNHTRMASSASDTDRTPLHTISPQTKPSPSLAPSEQPYSTPYAPSSSASYATAPRAPVAAHAHTTNAAGSDGYAPAPTSYEESNVSTTYPPIITAPGGRI